jgi:hypothetical protein
LVPRRGLEISILSFNIKDLIRMVFAEVVLKAVLIRVLYQGDCVAFSQQTDIDCVSAKRPLGGTKQAFPKS